MQMGKIEETHILVDRVADVYADLVLRLYPVRRDLVVFGGNLGAEQLGDGD